MLEVLGRRDLLDPVGAAEHRVEGDEAERDELGDAAGALLQGAHDPHVAGQLARLLDVAEHHGRGRAQAGAVRGLDDLDPALDRQLVRRDPLAHAVVEHLGRGPRRRAEPALEQVLEDLVGPLARALAHVVDLHRRVGVQVQLRRHLLGQPQPLAVLLQGQVRMDPPLHAELGRPELDRFADPLGEVLLGDLIGIGRAPPLAEPAEGAADDADVGEVDVAVDDEGDPVPGQLRPQLVGSHPHLLDHLRPGLGEQRRQLVLAQLHPLAALRDRLRRPAPRRCVSSLRRPDPRRGMKLQYFSLITSRTPCSIHSESMYCG